MMLDFHPDAEVEMEDAALWYEGQSFGLGDRFVAAVEAASSAIQLAPDCYQRIDGDVRVCRLRHFPYLIYYVHFPLIEHVRLYAVMHEKRRPGYWKARLPKP